MIDVADVVVDTLADPGTITFPSGVDVPPLLTVTFTAGYPTPDAIPTDIVQGLLLAFGTFHAHREGVADLDETQRSVVPLPPGERPEDLWAPYRIVSLA